MPYISIAAFALLYLAATMAWGISKLLAAAYMMASVICFIAYALDKSAARNARRRTPENTLLLLGLAGGWPGAVLAQQWLRHKSVKTAFLRKFWASVAVNVAGFAFAGYWYGSIA